MGWYNNKVTFWNGKIEQNQNCLMLMLSQKKGDRFQHAHLANDFQKSLATKLVITLSYNITQYFFIKGVF